MDPKTFIYSGVFAEEPEILEDEERDDGLEAFEEAVGMPDDTSDWEEQL